MAKRLVRAKQKIRNAGIPYRVPPAHLLPERTTAVLGVLYLLFNEGYAASAGADLIRQDLCGEAIRLARLLAALMPDEPEAAGLLALMLLHDARRATRVDEAGDLVTLEDQDRARWDAAEIAEGVALLEARCAGAAPARTRCRRPSRPATPPRRRGRHRLAADRRAVRAAGPVRALARGGAEPGGRGGHGRRAGGRAGAGRRLAAGGELAGYHLLPATRADLLRRLGRTEAADAYREALDLAAPIPSAATSPAGWPSWRAGPPPQ